MAAKDSVVYGLHAVESVLERRPEAVRRAFVLDSARGGRVGDIVATLEAQAVPVQTLSRAELDRRCRHGTHQGVAIEVQPRASAGVNELEALVAARGRRLRLLILDRVEDPRNLGACLRTADAAGVDAIVVPKAHTAKLGAAAEKAAAGAAESVPVTVVPNLARTLDWLKRAGVWVVGADADAGQSLFAAKLAPPIAVVLGAEGKGLRRLTRESCDELVAIPMHGTVASLNVSVAAGIVLYELCRQAPP